MHDFPQSLVAAYKMPLKSPLIAAIMRVTDDVDATCYEELPCSLQDADYIHEIITILGTNNKVNILIKINYLNTLGSYINHVHPMKFLTTIFKNPQLKQYLVPIFDDYFKRNGFMDGVGPSMNREIDRDNLFQYVNEFAEDLGVPFKETNKFFLAKDWEGLVRFLMQHARG